MDEATPEELRAALGDLSHALRAFNCLFAGDYAAAQLHLGQLDALMRSTVMEKALMLAVLADRAGVDKLLRELA